MQFFCMEEIATLDMNFNVKISNWFFFCWKVLMSFVWRDHKNVNKQLNSSHVLKLNAIKIFLLLGPFAQHKIEIIAKFYWSFSRNLCEKIFKKKYQYFPWDMYKKNINCESRQLISIIFGSIFANYVSYIFKVAKLLGFIFNNMKFKIN
jgi:hypothetical protein